MKSHLSNPSLVIAFWIAFGTQFSTAFSDAAEPPVRIIFDTDVDHDCDDIGALFLLHGALQRGEAKLLATIGCTSTDQIAPCLDAINTWFGRPDIPVATLKDKGFLDHQGFAAEIARRGGGLLAL